MKKLPTNKTPILSVIILDYNAGHYLHDLFKSICNSVLKNYIEVILVDNASSDNSLEEVKNFGYQHPQINFKYLQTGANIGFAAGNNRGVKIVDPKSKYVLFLNPDTTVDPNTFQGMVDYFETHPQVDAATCYIELALTGQLQPESHRGFPTPWNTFWHFFGIGLPKLFPKSKLLNGYFLSYLDYTQVQEIDCCVGAFLMLKQTVGQAINWWSEKYFMYGEDIDICYQIHKLGYRLFYIPNYKITHYQGISSGIKKAKSAATRMTKIRSAKATTNAMRIFYKENLINNYPLLLRPLIFLGIDLLELNRVFKAKLC